VAVNVHQQVGYVSEIKIINSIIYICCVIALGYLDRARGNVADRFEKWASIALSALCICILLDEYSWTSLWIYLGYAVGASIGWGNAIGPALFNQPPNPHKGEWWQKGKLLENAWYALVFRGLLWSFCLTPGMYKMYTSRVDAGALVLATLLAYPIAMPTACYLSYKGGGTGNQRWANQEWTRGSVVGLVILLGVLIV